MAASVLFVAGLIGLALVATGVIAPLLLVPIVILGMLPLAIGIVGKVFAHSQPTVDAAQGPATPSTRQASYDPVTDPGDRGV
ncbi:MAG TPA: hypothetical protein VGR12_07780 [Solirubrobacteraceae bacterium]|nr:hypothetical protein [Solirubrobacteraceae bacterium]